jgi:hypothetical protein
MENRTVPSGYWSRLRLRAHLKNKAAATVSTRSYRHA